MARQRYRDAPHQPARYVFLNRQTFESDAPANAVFVETAICGMRFATGQFDARESEQLLLGDFSEVSG
jgi:hypothetical protein